MHIKTREDLYRELFEDSAKDSRDYAVDNWKKLKCDCHCHNECKKCVQHANKTCMHCTPDEFKEDRLTPIRNKVREEIQDNYLHGEDCGWNYYGHRGYYCGCRMESSIREEIELLMQIFIEHKDLL